MKQKYNLLLIAGLILVSLIIVGCTNQNNIQTNNNSIKSVTPREAYCNNLVTALDAQIIDTQNPPGRFIISGLGEKVGEVGGTLTDIKNNTPDRGYNSYVLTFMSKNASRKGELYLLTMSNETLPYNIGTFYSFDLNNINKYSAATSGMFMDNELNKLTAVDCWPME